jgi:Kef-type K+ transport system membrane component KefB
MAGMICPHEGGFSIKVTEKIEDLVSAIFLPLYFALSGLSTNLGLLNNGITWGYVVAVIVLAFSGKIIGGTLAAKACRLVWRESFSIGVLMSCKGLVELIVLVGVSTLLLVSLTNWVRILDCKPRSFLKEPSQCLWLWRSLQPSLRRH